MEVLSFYVQRTDDRGLLWGISQQPWIQEINYIETTAGHIRGNHYHTETQEMFFLIEGRVRVAVHNIQTGEKEEHIFEKGDIFIVYPYEVHTFHTLTDAKWINMLSKPIQKDDPDFHRYEALSIESKDRMK